MHVLEAWTAHDGMSIGRDELFPSYAFNPLRAHAVHDFVTEQKDEIAWRIVFRHEHVDQLVRACRVLHEQQARLDPGDVEDLEAMRGVRESAEGMGRLVARNPEGEQSCERGSCVVDVIAGTNVHWHFELFAMRAHGERAALLAPVENRRDGDVGHVMRTSARWTRIIPQMSERAMPELERCAAFHAFDHVVEIGHALVIGVALDAEPNHFVGNGMGNGCRHLAVRVENEHRFRRLPYRLDDVVARRRPRRIPVDLIAVEVRDDEDLRMHRRQEDLRRSLVALDDGPLVLALAAERAVEAQRRRDALLEIRARRVVSGAAIGVDNRLLDHMRRRGLAVRARDDDRVVPLTQLADDVAVDLERELAGQCAACATEQAHQLVRRLAHGDGNGTLDGHDVPISQLYR